MQLQKLPYTFCLILPSFCVHCRETSKIKRHSSQTCHSRAAYPSCNRPDSLISTAEVKPLFREQPAASILSWIFKQRSLSKSWLRSNRIHGVTFQKAVIFIAELGHIRLGYVRLESVSLRISPLSTQLRFYIFNNLQVFRKFWMFERL
jgi:hypothetical protein